ncbi:MAG: hypothetical protein KGP35_09990, partial [Bacteroidetes bacterium]|nr:hypothetical protein [Bacteroidota bacterium]
SATHNGTLTARIAASGVNSVVSYTSGNGGTYLKQTIASTGVTGLTATLEAGTLANGSGTLTYFITGTPSANGTASFALSIGGQSCTLNRMVNFGVTGITAHSCGATNVHNPTIQYGTMTDQQGNIYRTVQIGTQTWMAENLRTTVYRNLTPIENGLDNTVWASDVTGAYCNFYNNPSTDCPYGKLYNWYAVKNTNQLCPTGWHVPTDAEWNVLIANLDPSYNPTGLGLGSNSSTAGGKMKSTGTQYWLSPNTGATNSSGFSGLPGGYRSGLGPFTDRNVVIDYTQFADGIWWSSTERVSGLYRYLRYNSGDVTRDDSGGKNDGLSVRCLRD